MSYVPDPTNVDFPKDNETPASTMAWEFRAMKAHLASYVVPLAAGAATLASPAFTGIPTAPTAAPSASGNQLATLDYVDSKVVAATLPSPASKAGLSLGSDGATVDYRHSSADALAVLNFLGF